MWIKKFDTFMFSSDNLNSKFSRLYSKHFAFPEKWILVLQSENCIENWFVYLTI